MKPKLTCGVCADAGVAEPLPDGRLLCVMAQVPTLRGQECVYAVATMQLEWLVSSYRTERLERLLQVVRAGETIVIDQTEVGVIRGGP